MYMYMHDVVEVHSYVLRMLIELYIHVAYHSIDFIEILDVSVSMKSML